MSITTSLLTAATTDARLQALEAAKVSPATSTPPAVTLDGATGVAALTFARADHTHASSVQAAKVAVAGTSGIATWTYPRAFPAGSLPIAIATCVNVSGATQPLVANIVGDPTNTAVTIQVFKAAPTTLPGVALSLLGFVVNTFSNAPALTYVNVLVRMPS